MKKKVFLSIIATLFILFGVNQYLEKQRYEDYLSLQVANDFSRLSFAIFNSQRIYEEVLSTETISLEQVKVIFDNKYSISRITQDYQGFGSDLNRINRNDVENLPALNTSSIAEYFRRLSWDKAEKLDLAPESVLQQFPYPLEEVGTFPIEQKQVEAIEMFTDLNSRWINVINKYVKGANEGSLTLDSDVYFAAYGDTALKEDYWTDVVVAMDVATREFLKEHNIYPNQLMDFLY